MNRWMSALAGPVFFGLAPAVADDVEACMSLSFAPLDMNIPACTRLIEEGGLPDAQTAALYASRAEAYRFARTYSLGHDVDDLELLNLAEADFDAAVALDPAYRGSRGEVRYMLGRHEEAIEDFTAMIALEPQSAHYHRVNRSYAYEYLGEFDAAIEDVTIALDAADGPIDEARLYARRGELHEAAGDAGAAAADYRAVLERRPDHQTVREALARIEDAD